MSNPEQIRSARIELTSMFDELFRNAAFSIPPEDKRWIDEFVENYEFALAFETLVDVIEGEGMTVGGLDRRRLETLGMKMNLPSELWERLPSG